MLAIMSPARNIRPRPFEGIAPERPVFLTDAVALVEALRAYSPWELESILELNDMAALEMHEHYRRFDAAEAGTPALSSYYGAAFWNMNVSDFELADFLFAEEHLRIMSALYGLLRPGDGVLPHRLGMQSDFRINGQDLYEFWGKKIYAELFRTGEPVVCLASMEYAKLVRPYLMPGDTFITCSFLLQKPDGVRGTVSTVRAARGQMARFMIKNRIVEPEQLKHFNWDGYRLIEGRSTPGNYVFVRAPQ